MYTGRKKEHPECWEENVLTGLPKKEDTEEVLDFRWITISNRINQWYNRTWRDLFREKQEGEEMHTWGFTKGLGPDVYIHTSYALVPT